MQVLKEEVKAAIIKSALQEFLAKGYINSSMRTIAKNADVTVGNLYRYFKNKEALFNEIMNPVTTTFIALMQQHENEEHFEQAVDPNLNVLQEIDNQLMPIIDTVLSLKDRIMILLYGSKGTKYENIKEQIVIYGADHVMEHFNLMYPEDAPEKSFELARAVSIGFIESILDIINNITDHDTLKLTIKEYIKLFIMGFIKSS